MKRDPYDGKPYYCTLCTANPQEMKECIGSGLTDRNGKAIPCMLETEAVAQLRKLRRRQRTTALPSTETES